MTPIKWLILSVLVLALLIQFLGPAKTNPPVDASRAVAGHLQVPPQIGSLLQRACRNCHSHQTQWPWYSNVAPVSWFVIDHVNHARREMNLSEWDQYDREEARHLLEEVCEMVETREMPLEPYVWMHAEARLTEADIEELCGWTRSERQRLLNESGDPEP